jgi:ABC-type Zn uptake system ZnuABC Zn-binding protein ZnuA
MGLAKYLDESQRAEASSLLLAAVGNFARIIQIIEQATASIEDETTRQQVEMIRQLATAIDVNVLFPSPKMKSLLMEHAREVVEATFNGPAPSVTHAPAAPRQPQTDTSEEWQDTIE